MEHGHLEQECDLLGARVRPPRRKQNGQGCKQEDVSPRRAMFSRLGGLAPPKWFSLFLSLLGSSLEHILGFHLSLYLLLFLLFAWAMFPGYDNVCFTFPVPYWAIPLECWQFLFYFPALLVRIVHDVYIYIYICLYLCG